MRVKRSIVVRRAPGNPREGRLALAHGIRRAALGRSGIAALKKEGDGATPLGRYGVRKVLYRDDRLPRPRTRLPIHAIRPADGWCENPADRNYNKLVKLSGRTEADSLHRADHLYDLVLVLGYNDRPRVRGRGSAIFVHLARPDYAPTAGCIALERHDLLMLLAQLTRGSAIVVVPYGAPVRKYRPRTAAV
jgi:L,D-peptidoglycan transpeptidase YkuD (ErfK/YbiS/YcfS/YnhG family)